MTNLKHCSTLGCTGTCDVCREYARQRRQAILEYRRSLLAANPDIRPHGNVTTYIRWGCHCDKCRQAGTQNRYRWVMSAETALTERRDGLRGKAQPFGREWLDAGN